MSNRMLNLCWKVKNLTQAHKLVLMRLADFSNDKKGGKAWPCMDTLAIDCCCSRRTVARAIRYLEGVNLISHERRFSESNVYSFNENAIIEASFDSDNYDIHSDIDDISKEFDSDNDDTVCDNYDIHSDIDDTSLCHGWHTNHENPKEPIEEESSAFEKRTTQQAEVGLNSQSWKGWHEVGVNRPLRSEPREGTMIYNPTTGENQEYER